MRKNTVAFALLLAASSVGNGLNPSKAISKEASTSQSPINRIEKSYDKFTDTTTVTGTRPFDHPDTAKMTLHFILE